MERIKRSMLALFVTMLSLHQLNAQCPIPAGLTAVSIGATISNLTWQPISGVTSYLVNVENGRNNPTTFLVTGTTVNPMFTVNGLTGGFAYKFKVRSNCGGNHSSWSPWFTFVAGGGTINCNLLTGLAISNVTSTGSTFTWNASAGGLGYRVKVEDGSGNPVNFSFAANTLTNSYSITGLNPASNYKVKIRKLCAVGVTGPWSAWMPFTTAALRLSGSTETDDAFISMYPNPASLYFQLDMRSDSEEKISKVELYDITGKMVLDRQVENVSTYQVPLQDVYEGVYVVKVLTNTKVFSKRLVIVK